MNRQEWNEKYAAQDLLWGAEPNRFVEAELRDLAPRGRALDVACGEGRNAIWLAKLGWTVTGVDYSEVAIERARSLAAAQNAAVEWVCADLGRWDFPVAAFDLVLIAYLQIPPDDFRSVLRRAAQSMKPGATLFLIGHARINVTEGVGGPRAAEVCWDPQELRRDLLALGLAVGRAEHVRRPVETPGGVRDAIDTLARAEKA